MSLTDKLQAAAENGLRPLPSGDPVFEDKITELYRSMIVFSDLPMACSQGDRMSELKKRFAVYWTYEAIEADPVKGANWRDYLDQCIDSPGFLDSDNVAVMIDQIGAGIAEGKLSYETLIGVNPSSVIAIAQIPSEVDVAEEVLKPYDPQRLPHIQFSRLPDPDLTDGDIGGGAV